MISLRASADLGSRRRCGSSGSVLLIWPNGPDDHRGHNAGMFDSMVITQQAAEKCVPTIYTKLGIRLPEASRDLDDQIRSSAARRQQ